MQIGLSQMLKTHTRQFSMIKQLPIITSDNPFLVFKKIETPRYYDCQFAPIDFMVKLIWTQHTNEQ